MADELIEWLALARTPADLAAVLENHTAAERSWQRERAEFQARILACEAVVALVEGGSHASYDAMHDAVEALTPEGRAALAARHELERRRYGDLADCTREVLYAEIRRLREIEARPSPVPTTVAGR